MVAQHSLSSKKIIDTWLRWGSNLWKSNNLVHPNRNFKVLRLLEKLAHIFICLFSGLYWIRQGHPDELGEHLSSSGSSTADAQAHLGTLHKVYLVLFHCSGLSPSTWKLPTGEPGRLLPTRPAPLLLSVDLFRQSNHIFQTSPRTFIWTIRVNWMNFTSTVSHQRPSSESSGWTGWTIWPSPSCEQIFPRTTQVIYFNCVPCSGLMFPQRVVPPLPPM